MITEIYIENQRLDIEKDISTQFTYQIDEVTNFSSRNTNFSKTIILPGNATNNKLFGHIFEFGAANAYDSTQDNVGYNFNATKSADCLVFVDGIQIFKGIFQLLEIIIDNGTIEYEGVVFGDLGGFADSLGIKKIEELDFSQYDHAWTYPNIINSWQQASGTTASGMGYYYPLIDYGNVSYNNKVDWDVKAFRPAFFVREYMDKIITGAGYTWESDFFNTNFFKRLIIPNNSKELYRTSTNPVTGTSSNYNVLNQTTLTNTGIPATGFVLSNFVFVSGSGLRYTGADPLTVNANVLLIGEILNNTNGQVGIIIQKNGSPLAIYSYPPGGAGSTDLFNITFQQDITFVTNDIFNVYLTTTGAKLSNFVVNITNITLNFLSEAQVQTPASYGDMLVMNAIIPKGIKQKDFFTSIIKMFNLYVVEDKEIEKRLKIIPYIDYYNKPDIFLKITDADELFKVNDSDLLLLQTGAAEYLDWTYKIDMSKPFRLKPMSEVNGRYYEFKYKPDIDYYNEQYQKKYNEGYADREEDTGFDFASDRETAEVIFSPTVLVGYATDDKVVSTVFKKTNLNSNNPIEDRTEHNIRILQARKVTGVNNWKLQNGTQVLQNQLTEYGYAGHLDNPFTPTSDLNFGAPKELYYDFTGTYPTANIFNGFWSDYLAEITDKDSKLLSCYVKLTQEDIYSLDFSRLIWIRAALWRLNKVIDFNPHSNEPTKCEFIRVIELTYA